MKNIVEKQKSFKWGDGFLKQLSQDLQREFPEMQGWSERNLRRIRLWYQTYSQYFSIRTQAVSELKSTEPIPLAVPHVGLPSNITEENQLLGQDAFFSVPWGHHIVIMQRCKDLDTAYFYMNQTIEYNWSRSTLEYHQWANIYIIAM